MLIKSLHTVIGKRYIGKYDPLALLPSFRKKCEDEEGEVEQVNKVATPREILEMYREVLALLKEAIEVCESPTEPDPAVDQKLSPSYEETIAPRSSSKRPRSVAEQDSGFDPSPPAKRSGTA